MAFLDSLANTVGKTMMSFTIAVVACYCIGALAVTDDEKKTSHAAIPVLAIVGDVMSIGLYLAQVPTYLTIVKERKLEGHSVLPCVTTLVNSLLWGLYATPAVQYNLVVLIVCFVGVIVESIYLLIYIRYSPRHMKVILARWLSIILVAIGCGLAGIFFGWHEHEERKTPLGIVCVASGFAMYDAPCWDMLKACRSKKAKDIPVLLSIVGLANCSIWLAYSILKHDTFIKVQNIVGLVLSLVQVVAFTVLHCFHTPGEGFYFLCA